jgi:hypothetical protein
MLEVFERVISHEENGQWSVPTGLHSSRTFDYLRPAAEEALTQGLESGARVIKIFVYR